MNQTEQDLRIKELADNVLAFSRDSLIVNLRFLDSALSRLPLTAAEDIESAEGKAISAHSFATDGRRLYYNPRILLRNYKEEKNSAPRSYLHSLFHCIFGHIWGNDSSGKTDSQPDARLWNLACDIACESAIAGLSLACLDCEKEQRQLKVFSQLSGVVDMMTADKIYRHYVKARLSEEELSTLERLFLSDSHSLWPCARIYETTENETSASTRHVSTGATTHGESSNIVNPEMQANTAKSTFAGEMQPEALSRLKNDWKNISRRMQIDMETFARRQAGKAGALMQSLKEANRETSDYRAFLRTFAVKGDGMKLNPDEFDLITYSYGMQMSGGKVPLIEPTEYRSSMRVRDFVLAIETVSLPLEKVTEFIRTTWDILHDTETYFSKARLHILDGNETIITSDEEMDDYIKDFHGPARNLETQGDGEVPGVDSRAVFNRVSELSRRRGFRNLRGLLVFTDTSVTYPANMPPFKAAFIFARDDYSSPAVPPWAIRLVINSDDL